MLCLTLSDVIPAFSDPPGTSYSSGGWGLLATRVAPPSIDRYYISSERLYDFNAYAFGASATPGGHSRGQRIFRLLLLLSFLFNAAGHELFTGDPGTDSPDSDNLSLGIVTGT